MQVFLCLWLSHIERLVGWSTGIHLLQETVDKYKLVLWINNKLKFVYPYRLLSGTKAARAHVVGFTESRYEMDETRIFMWSDGLQATLHGAAWHPIRIPSLLGDELKGEIKMFPSFSRNERRIELGIENNPKVPRATGQG
jgi:hypothetical protein